MFFRRRPQLKKKCPRMGKSIKECAVMEMAADRKYLRMRGQAPQAFSQRGGAKSLLVIR